ncbi:uncharacterized protein LOC129719975 [Wyeomyia smithii]|uniref:uncharacterized protein LOC129719975 n=1 Tax=Wyeomyia smithii TaxID=174621 RepID=UPI0024682135|nr:uncharacterized protein LOC129719975 [Wyeomyia smithii]
MLYSVESEEEATKLVNDVRSIYAEGGFEICGWLSNSQKVLASLGENRIGQKKLNQIEDLGTEKVLGLWWDTGSDILTFKTPKRCGQYLLPGQQVPTKREVLRTLMSVFDPIGLLANILMYLKTWLNVLREVESVAAPRCYRIATSSIVETNEIQLHVFVDASENGYATVAYFRYEDGGVIECAFVAAKTRVAPLKYVSIPRLELEAAKIGMRLAHSIGETHRIAPRRRFFWSDSRDVLCWLRSDHRRYSKFVAARVGEILENTDISEWFWISTKLNVADEGTKWQKIPDLSPSSRWFRGPDFLWQRQSAWPDQPESHGSTDNEMNLVINIHAHRVPVINFSKYSTWEKLVRIVAYGLRFYKNLR